jgi:ribosomal protein L28
VTAGSADFIREAGRRLEHVADAFLSVNTPVQLAAVDLLRRAEPLRAAVRARVAQNEAALRAWVAACGQPCSVLPRPAGWSAILALPPEGRRGARPSARGGGGVWAHPGYFYGMPASTPCVVLSLLTNPDAFFPGFGGFGPGFAPELKGSLTSCQASLQSFAPTFQRSSNTMSRICSVTVQAPRQRPPYHSPRSVQEERRHRLPGWSEQTKRTFSPNVQRIRVLQPNGSVKRQWVSVKALKAGLVTKA